MIKIFNLSHEGKMSSLANIKISNEKALEGGLYSLREASLYAQVPLKTLKQWYLGDKKVKRVFINNELIEQGEYIGFLDFVQALGIRELRLTHNMSLFKIREAIKIAYQDYGIEHLFAKEHKIMFDKKRIIIETGGALIQLTSPNINQFTMPIVAKYLKKLSFNQQGYAFQYRPQEGILLDPKRRFGEPLVEKSGVTALALHDAFVAESDYEIVAKIYEVKVGEVLLAYNYINSLKKAA